MIAHLKGTVEKISDNLLIIDVNGVGYSVICSARTVNKAKKYSDMISVFTVLSVREDSWTLYGFISEQEKFWFNALVSVQGVGGKAAIAILSALSDEDIYNAFLTGDKEVFTKADGVGQKLAIRILTELKDKIIGKVDLNIAAKVSNIHESSVINDVVSALSNLGYQKSDIFQTISQIQIEDDIKFDVLLKRILSKVSSGG